VTTDFDTHMEQARETARGFLERVERGARLVVFCHFDADGLAAGAVFGRALRRLGYSNVIIMPSARAESAFSDDARTRIAAVDPDALIVTDLGVHRGGVLPDVPTLYVDHHRPEGEPADASIISAYAWDPIPNSAWLAYEVMEPLVDVDDMGWVAAVGTLSDLGDSAPWPRLPEIKKRYTAKWLKEAVSSVNAARRASSFDIATPLRFLMEAEHPRQLVEDVEHGADRLQEYRREVNAELQMARRAAPVFSRTHPFALVRISSACQIHPLIAQQWRTRLPKFAVIAANSGYMPGRVAFSTRTARTDLKLPELFRTVDLGVHNEDFGHGHDQASGGNLPPEIFDHLLRELGFDIAP
jgi:single-stranded-DNA-specific exonuclease